MSDNRYYSLLGHEVLPFDDVLEWAAAYELLTVAQRTVGRDQVGEVLVSTVFLGLDYRHFGSGPPLLFETMTFPDCRVLDRYGTWEGAEEGHASAVAEIRARLVGATN